MSADRVFGMLRPRVGAPAVGAGAAIAAGRRGALLDGADGEREVRSIVSRLHAWEQILTYMRALEAFPPVDEFESPTVGGVLAELR